VEFEVEPVDPRLGVDGDALENPGAVGPGERLPGDAQGLGRVEREVGVAVTGPFDLARAFAVLALDFDRETVPVLDFHRTVALAREPGEQRVGTGPGHGVEVVDGSPDGGPVQPGRPEFEVRDVRRAVAQVLVALEEVPGAAVEHREVLGELRASQLTLLASLDSVLVLPANVLGALAQFLGALRDRLGPFALVVGLQFDLEFRPLEVLLDLVIGDRDDRRQLLADADVHRRVVIGVRSVVLCTLDGRWCGVDRHAVVHGTALRVVHCHWRSGGRSADWRTDQQGRDERRDDRFGSRHRDRYQ